jgi:hypothetical protein
MRNTVENIERVEKASSYKLQAASLSVGSHEACRLKLVAEISHTFNAKCRPN